MLRALFRFILSFLFALLALVLTAVLVLYFKRDWQRELLDAALEARTGLQWQFGEAYFERADRFRGSSVFALKGSEGVELRSVELDFDLGRSWSGDWIAVESGVLEGVSLDLSGISSSLLGLSPEILRQAMPSEEQTIEAVKILAEEAVRRIGEAGYQLEIEDLEVEGAISLPFNRLLQYSLTLHYANSRQADQSRLEVHAAEYR